VNASESDIDTDDPEVTLDDIEGAFGVLLNFPFFSGW
jgi:hypothetical protein